LWFALCSYGGLYAISAYPADCPDNRHNDCVYSGSGAGVGSCSDELNAVSKDPGTFTLAPSWWNANTVAVRPAIAIPIITALSDSCLAVGQVLTIDGSNFGAAQGTGHVDFTGGGVAAITSWTDAQIVCTVPVDTIRGSVTVTNDEGGTSAGYAYGMHPIIAVFPLVGAIGDPITVTGLHFGVVQGTGSVTVSGVIAAITSWSNIQVVAAIPVGVFPGVAIIVLTNDDGCASNIVNFTVAAGGRRRILQIPPIGWPIGGGLGRPPIMG
jgi:hypothetical protein